jgi:hypothetical protein
LSALPELPQGAVFYVDNFGNIKLNFRHRRLLELYPVGAVLAVRLGGSVCDAVLGDGGFSQGEGVVALTEGSSGWRDAAGEKNCFTEIFLRGARADRRFKDFHPGDRVWGLAKATLEKVINVLYASGPLKLDLDNMSEARIIEMLVHAGLIQDGFDALELHKRLDRGTLADALAG